LGDEWTIAKDLKKLIGLIDKRYLEVGPCQNTVPQFPVTKAIKDNKVVNICVIWDLRKSGYNAFTFTPKFQLPMASLYTRCLEAGVYGGDFDIGAQFHNYMLHPKERPFFGVEVPVEDIPHEVLDNLTKQGFKVSWFMRWN